MVALIKLMISGYLEENQYYVAKKPPKLPQLIVYCTVSVFLCQSGHNINDFSFFCPFSRGACGVMRVIGTLQPFEGKIV